MSQKTTLSLAAAVHAALQQYYTSLKGEVPTALHGMVIDEVEKALFENVMQMAAGNQSLAAKILGINRNTLRMRLAKFGML